MTDDLPNNYHLGQFGAMILTFNTSINESKLWNNIKLSSRNINHQLAHCKHVRKANSTPTSYHLVLKCQDCFGKW